MIGLSMYCNVTKYEKIHVNVLQGKKRIAKVVKFTKSSLV